MSRKTHLLWCAVISNLNLSAIDLNNDGMCDVWESRYRAGALLPDDDEDQDGWTNLDESKAGTDPFSKESFLEAKIRLNNENDFEVVVPCEPGKQYQLYTSSDLSDSWMPSGSAIVANSDSHTFAIAQPPIMAFYKVIVSDADGDLDTVSNWAELQMDGFNPGLYDSFLTGSQNGDLTAMQSLLNDISGAGFSIEQTAPDAYELEGSDAIITINRSGDLSYPLTLYFKAETATETGRGQADTSDYQLNIPDRIVIPAGSISGELRVSPILDTEIEVPELLDVFFGLSSTPARVRICDASNDPENDRLMIARLRHISGVSTNASGLSVLRLNGSNERAVVTVDFSNLIGTLTNTQILNTSESILQSVPPFNFQGQEWEIIAGNTYCRFAVKMHQ
ncbi:MAG: hypothetical protein ACPGN3_08210 [Opitutales bacterium]